MSSIQRGAYALYRYLVVMFAAGCVVQIFLAGRGVFGIRSSSTPKTVNKFFDDQASLDPQATSG
jgi:hypothetical protein